MKYPRKNPFKISRKNNADNSSSPNVKLPLYLKREMKQVEDFDHWKHAYPAGAPIRKHFSEGQLEETCQK